MTTFQAIVLSLVGALTDLLPLSSEAHLLLLTRSLGWAEPGNALLVAIHGGSLLGLLFWGRHDWLSMLSGLLQVVLLRRKPMTVDERMPLYLLVGTLPAAGAAYYGWHGAQDWNWSTSTVCLVLAAGGLALVIGGALGRDQRKTVDIQVLDALLIGAAQAAFLVPGFGRATGALAAGLLRNFRRDAAVKLSLFLSLPVLTLSLVHHATQTDWAPGPGLGVGDLSWLSFGVAVLVSALVTLLAIAGIFRAAERGKFRGYAVLRFLVAGAAFAWLSFG